MAWIPAVIGAVATLYGQHQANKNAKDLRNQQQPLLDNQMELMKMLQPYGQQFLGQGQDAMGFVKGYLEKLASGNRELTSQAVAPEINTLTRQQQGSVATQRGLFPRGGTTASQASQLPQQLQGNINNLLFSVRPQAMSQLGQLGGNMASIGSGLLGQSGGLTNSMLNYGLNAQQQMFGQGQQIGQGVSSLIGPFMQYMMMNNAQRGNLNPNATPGAGWTNPNIFGQSAPPSNSTPSGGFSLGSNYGSYSSSNNPYSGGK